MRTFFKLVAVAVAGAVLAACGSEDFTGAYRLKDSDMKVAIVLNIHGDEAELFADDGKGGIKSFGKMKVLVKDGKLGDIAPSVLTLLDLEIPKEMTGNVLINKQ